MFDLMRRIRKLQQKRIEELTLETEEQSQSHSKALLNMVTFLATHHTPSNDSSSSFCDLIHFKFGFQNLFQNFSFLQIPSLGISRHKI